MTKKTMRSSRERHLRRNRKRVKHTRRSVLERIQKKLAQKKATRPSESLMSKVKNYLKTKRARKAQRKQRRVS